MKNDLISRSAAKDEILSLAVIINKPHLLSKEDTLHVLDTLPAVDAEEVFKSLPYVKEALEMAKQTVAPVRHGRWEECDWVEFDGHSECVRYPKKGRVCTNCRNAFKKEFIDSPRVHYCPHCGAKMESGTALSEAEPLEGCVDDADLEHMTRFAMQQAIKQK